MLVSYEDGRFYEHRGVDPRALLRATGQWLWRGRIVSGGSTLSMQVARLIEPRREHTLSAKLRQIARALAIERAVGKSGVLDRYLTLAPFGGNLDGVRAASLAYFGKEPKKLGLAEAALLVALPQSPEARRPDRFPNAARSARDRVLTRAVARGVISADDAAAAKREPVPAARKPFPMLAAHAAEEAVAADPKAKRIRLSIDARLQAKLEAASRLILSRLNGWPIGAPADASSPASRPTTRGSGPMRFAIPSSQWTGATYSSPASRRTVTVIDVAVIGGGSPALPADAAPHAAHGEKR